MLPVVLDSRYREKTGTNIDYMPYQFLPFMEIFDKTEKGFALKKEAGNQLIIDDDFGTGLITETGIIVSQLLENNPDLRVLILVTSPEHQVWKKEMYDHFGLDFQIYNSTDKRKSDLLIMDFCMKYDFDFSDFDVQIIYRLDFITKGYHDPTKEKLNSSPINLLRIFIHSDICIDNNDKSIPCTKTLASTVSSYKITKSIEDCTEDTDITEHFKKYLIKQKSVIFTLKANLDTMKEALLKALLNQNNSRIKIFSFTDPTKPDDFIEFRKSSSKALLICSYPYVLNLSFCGTAIHYDVLGEKSSTKRNGLICKANRKKDVDIVYFAKTAEDKETAEEYIKEHNEKLKTKEQDLENIKTKVEKYLSTVNGSENADDKKRLEELKGEKQ